MKPEILNILVDNKFKNKESSLIPKISWQYYSSQYDEQQSFRVKIGTEKCSGDIYDSEEINSSENEHHIPTSGYSSQILNGIKYFVTVQVSNSFGYSEEKCDYFYTKDSYWETNVDNSIGWSLSFVFKNDQDNDKKYHNDIEVFDGTYAFSIEFYIDKIIVKTNSDFIYQVDTTVFRSYFLSVINKDISLYIDNKLALYIKDKNDIETDFKKLNIGIPSNENVKSVWNSIYLNLDKNLEPNSTPPDLINRTILFNNQEIVSIAETENSNKRLVATNPNDSNLSGKIYSVKNNAEMIFYDTMPILSNGVNNIINNGNEKWFSTFDKLFKMTGEKNKEWSKEISLKNIRSQDDFVEIESCSLDCADFTNDMLRIDTINSEPNKEIWFYKTALNSDWANNVENSKGWTIEFDLSIVNSQDNKSAGIEINDGKYQETIYLFEDKIELKYIGKNIFENFKNKKNIRIIGKNNDILIYVKEDNEWKLIFNGVGLFKEPAQNLTQSSIPVLKEYNEKIYALWHGNKDGNFQIYLSKFNGINWEQEIQLTFTDSDSFNPDFFIDKDGFINFTYQDNKFGTFEIIYSKFNGYKVFENKKITDTLFDSNNPKIIKTVDENIHIIWKENKSGKNNLYRAIFNGEIWISSNFDMEDEEILNDDINVVSFDISYDQDDISIVFEDDETFVSTIKYKEIGSSDNILVSNSFFPAFKPSIDIDENGAHIVWEDARFGSNLDIFYKLFDGINFKNETKITNSSDTNINPNIFISENFIYVSFIKNDALISIFRSEKTNNINFEKNEFGNINNGITKNNIIVYKNEKILSTYTQINNSYNTIFSFESNFIENKSFIDISEYIIKASNSLQYANISFGNINNSGRSISNWFDLKYSYERSFEPLIIESFDFNNIIDIDFDSNNNIYIIDNNNINAFNTSFNKLSINDSLNSLSKTAKFLAYKIFINKNDIIFASSKNKLYYHLPIFSDDIDPNNEWNEVYFDFNIDEINTIVQINGQIWVGTNNLGIIIFNINEILSTGLIDDNNSTIINEESGLSSNNIIEINSEDKIMIGTDKGLNTINGDNISVLNISDGLIGNEIKNIVFDGSVHWLSTENGLMNIDKNNNIKIFRNKHSSNHINDLLIDDKKYLWVATHKGIDLFNNSSFSSTIKEEDGFIVNSNLDGRRFKILTEDNLDKENYNLSFINKEYIDESEYIFDNINKLLLFKNNVGINSKLNFVYFKGVKTLYDFDKISILIESGSFSEKRIIDIEYDFKNNHLIITFLIDGRTVIYRASDNNENTIVYPFGTIILDKTPPLGTIDIVEQLSSDEVLLKLTSEDEVSGVDSMIVSNFSNFTFDGNTPDVPQPFKESLSWKLSNNLKRSENLQDLSSININRFHIHQIVKDDEIENNIIASSTDAILYKLNKQTKKLEPIFNFNEESISSIESHLGKLYIGTSNNGNVYVSEDLINFSIAFQVDDKEAFSMKSATNNTLYIGTNNKGKIYEFENDSLKLLKNLQENSINDIEELNGFIYYVTSSNGRIYRKNINNDFIEIIHDDVDANVLTISLSKNLRDNSKTIYVGTDPSGKILRLIPSRNIFVKSFESDLETVSKIRTFFDSNENIISTYSIINNKIYNISNDTWKLFHISEKDILDIVELDEEIFAINSEKMFKLSNDNFDRTVYLKLIDFAGNETELFNKDGELKEPTDNLKLFDTLTSEEFSGFSLKNRIFVVDEDSNINKTITGNSKFLSADKIDIEKGEYISEIFDGTNDLISWDSISYNANKPTNTEILIQIKSANSTFEIKNKLWSEPVQNGEDLSGIEGQLIQFKVTLLSESRGITPVLNNVTIKSKSSFAVHYFSTNFELPSNLKSGIITANTVIPIGTEIIFGVNTNKSANWKDYQIVDLNKSFTIKDNEGDNLKIGARLISDTNEVPELHELAMIFALEDGQLVKINLDK